MPSPDLPLALPVAEPLRRPAPRSAWGVMRSVLFALYLRELKTRLDGRWGSALWVIGEPLLNLGAMLAVFGALRATTIGGVDTVLFLVTGLLPYYLFKSLVLQLMGAIDANQALFGYRQVRPFDALIARAGVELSLFAGLMLAFMGGLLWLGFRVWPAQPLEMVGLLLLLTLLGFTLGLLAAVATAAYLTRARSLVRMVFLPLNLCSGVLIPIASLPQVVRDLLMFNPLAHLLEGVRAAFFGPAYHEPEGLSVQYPLTWVMVAAALGMALYRVRRHRLMPA